MFPVHIDNFSFLCNETRLYNTWQIIFEKVCICLTFLVASFVVELWILKIENLFIRSIVDQSDFCHLSIY